MMLAHDLRTSSELGSRPGLSFAALS